MKPFLLLSSLALVVLLPPLHAADTSDNVLREQETGLLGLLKDDSSARPSARRPSLDPKRIVNESNSFLKEREPDMTAEEYAVYEKVATMLTTNVDLAVRMLEAMMTEKERPSPAFEFILGNAYYAANQLDRAEQNYQSAVKRYPHFVRAWTNLGILYYTAGRFTEAAASFSKSIGLGDREPSTFGLLGYSLEKSGDLVSAEMAYLQAATADAANVDWKEGLLRIYIAGKQFGRAEPLVRALIAAKPNETRYWFDYAGILLAQHQKLPAMVVLEEAIAAGGAGPDELALLGDLYAEQNLAPEAISLYRKVLATARPRGEQKLLQFARVLLAGGHLPEAEQTLSAVTGELTPSARISLLHTRAEILMAKKSWPEARQQLDALLAIAPLNGPALLSLGRAYAEENNLPRATLAFEAACKITESTYQACLELANIELKNRHYARSVEYLERALSIEKTPVIEAFLARVRGLVPRETDAG